WLEEQGLKVLVMDPKTIDGIMNNIMQVGKLTGNEDLTIRKISDLEDRIDYITDRTSVLTEGQKPRILHVTWHDPLWTVGTDNFLNMVIGMAGGTNIFADTSGDVQVDIELAVTRNPQVITVVSGHGAAMRSSYDYVVAADSPFAETDAYINDNVFLINADMASRSGPRVVEALELFAKFIHPEIFP
ncbi:ABC transporter substrate-binding protein, partial [Chloroflexota bacterium]